MDRSTISAWLAINKLSYIEETFLEREISLEELVEFNNEELRDFAKELKLDALATKRFVKAIEDQKVLGMGSHKPKTKGNPALQMPKKMEKQASEVSMVSDEVAPAFNFMDIPEGMVGEIDKEVEGGNDEIHEGEHEEDKGIPREQFVPGEIKIKG
ncbi:hypothetical protein RFI_33190 [Reticulomyxa filosa]|uniref:SAM domain-containing protein n=1 Tax=Reticulomyxa filosa TaxID=46433 RepID=X6LRE7_RETFI|nr:hypothetical protein RFI_33190 [Reticulomyxa filosa]|eukprot:ETO04209.1 hypothetical protein RFI_33190 [Reticulomyxa filosa]